MSLLSFAAVRSFLLSLHKWAGLTLGLVLMLLALSGALLVAADRFDRLLSPQRYAVTGAEVHQTLAAYVAAAMAARPGASVQEIQMPAGRGAPVVVLLRQGEMRGGEMRGTGAPRQRHSEAGSMRERTPEAQRAGGASSGRERGEMHFFRAYLDPPTGRVLDIADARGGGAVATLRAFHTALLLPVPAGRPIIGAFGIVLLLLSLTGLVIWWPRPFKLASLVSFRRGRTLSFNLHQFIGLWIALPLAAQAFTGIYLAFPQALRPAIAAVMPMAPQSERRAPPLATMKLDPDVAFAAAAGHDALKLVSLTYPNRASKSWQIEATDASGGAQRFLVEDTSGMVNRVAEPPPGNRLDDLLRRLHMNHGIGIVWTAIALIAGLAPILFFITGVILFAGRQMRRKMRLAAGAPAEAETA